MEYTMIRTLLVVSLFTIGLLRPCTAGADTVYVVSKSTNKLLQFDTAEPGSVTTLTSSLFSPSALALGSDGNLYIAEWGNGDTIDPRISRFNLATQQLSIVATLDYATQQNPSSIAFRPASQGGEMLVGRLGAGPILKVAGWSGSGAAVSDYTTGLALDGGLGLATAADGTLYVSNALYTYVPAFGFAVASGPVVSFDAAGAYTAQVVADGSGEGGLSGPTGLLLSGQTLYATSVMNGKIFSTNLVSQVTTEFATTGNPFEAGPIAQLSNGSLLVGSVSGQSDTLYQFSSGGTLAGVFTNQDFGQVGGIVAVPEPGAIVLSAVGVVCLVGWLRRERGRSYNHR
jgi:hypothetical protein